ncbi:MAG TPA: hypothetical protein P5179_06215 [Candidatus Latescibacteria bacterium]|nr:hypothetical protein [Candidatus Latescibacterota bacterium]HRS94847.1 hypothetical protein [Candidatus Latescibacterota bacterium]
MAKRQLWLLAALSLFTGIELWVMRILLPVLRRRVGVFPGMGVTEILQPVVAAVLMAGTAVLLLWMVFGRRSAGSEVPAVRKAVAGLVLLVGLMQVLRVAAGIDDPWLDAARHVIAMCAIVLIAMDALTRGTTFGRASAGVGSLALFSSALYQSVILFYPTSITARWLATFAETMSLFMPWALSVVVTRRYMDDLVAVAGFAFAVVVSVALATAAAPAIHLIFAQATGFRHAVNPVLNVLTVGASVYFVIRSFRSEELPSQVPWAYIWLAASGIQMLQAHLQMAGLAALAVLAWTPPLVLPGQTRRWRFEKPEPVPAAAAVPREDEPPTP